MSALMPLSKRVISPANLLPALLLAVVAAAADEYIWLLLMVVSFLLAVQLFGEDVIVFTVTVGFVSLPNDIGVLFRDLFNALSLLMLLWLYLRKRFVSRQSDTPVPLYVTSFLLLIIGSMLLSSLLSGYLVVGIGETLRTAVFFMLWFIYYTLTDSEQRVRLLLTGLLTAGLVVSVPIIYGFLTSPNALLELARNAFAHEGGLFSNVGAAGGLLLISISLSFLYLLLHAEGVLQKLLLWLFIAIQASGLLLTNSRGAILGLGVSTLLILAILRRRFLLTRLIPGIVLTITAVLLSPAADEYINLYFRTDRVLENTRYVIWNMIFAMIADNPVFGLGPGVTKLSLERYVNVMHGTWQYSQIEYVFDKGGLGQAHNFLLFRWAETGIAGLLTSLALPFVFLAPVIRIVRHNNNLPQKTRHLIAGFGCIFTGMFARSVVEATGLISNGWITRDLPVWLLFAITLFYYQLAFPQGTKGGQTAE